MPARDVRDEQMVLHVTTNHPTASGFAPDSLENPRPAIEPRGHPGTVMPLDRHAFQFHGRRQQAIAYLPFVAGYEDLIDPLMVLNNGVDLRQRPRQHAHQFVTRRRPSPFRQVGQQHRLIETMTENAGLAKFGDFGEAVLQHLRFDELALGGLRRLHA